MKCECVCGCVRAAEGVLGGEVGRVGRVLGLELGGGPRLAWRGQVMKVWETGNCG